MGFQGLKPHLVLNGETARLKARPFNPMTSFP